MESWITVALFAGAVCFAIVAFLYLFLYSKYKAPYLLLWSCAWLSHALRSAVILAGVPHGPVVALQLVEQLLEINTGMFLLWGSLDYFGKPAGAALLSALLLGGVWAPAAVLLKAPSPWLHIPAYFYFAAALFANGYVMLKKSPPASIGGRIAGLALILWGIHNLDYPFLRPVAWFAPWGFLIGASLGLISAIAVIMAYFERLQEELARSENNFRTLFHGHNAPFLLIDPPTGDILDANQGAAEFYGYARDELRALNIARINTLPPGDIIHGLRRAINGGQKKFLFTHRLKNGDERNVEVYEAPVEVSGRTLLFSIVHDVTERQRAAAALLEAKQAAELAKAEWERTFDAVPHLIALIDTEHRIVRANRAMTQGLGCSFEELVGGRCHELVHGLPEPPEFCPHAKLLRSGELEQCEVFPMWPPVK
jgi:PAS domain S-box-containing protein